MAESFDENLLDSLGGTALSPYPGTTDIYNHLKWTKLLRHQIDLTIQYVQIHCNSIQD